MKKLRVLVLTIVLTAIILAVFLVTSCSDTGWSIINPFSGALFPPEFPAPAFEWKSESTDSIPWEVSLITSDKSYSINAVTHQNHWTPDQSEWDSLKIMSGFRKIKFTIKKHNNSKKNERIFLQISKDTVGAPILYREMPIPFIAAEKNLEAMNYMLIDPGSREKPHTAMKGFSVCGNCHSFSADGSTIGLDLDAGQRDKGGYFIAKVTDTILFDPNNHMSWSVLEKRRTFGLFSKLSPDGRYVVTTVKDRIIMKNFPYDSYDHITFSQLFFPVNGHLAIYDRQTHTIKELPGANLDEYVQSNAVWTPDGKYIIFSRAEALPVGNNSEEIDLQQDSIVNQFVKREKPFKYDLYKIPFNNGDGGIAEPIKGASDNGKSNYFPAVSPDGKWLIYCQADNFMLLMPDSRLYIVPANGGKARKLKCNMFLMNSWHAWSPNSNWIVFVSKGLSPYTDMFLTHIDENGNASIPVLVDRARAEKRVCNYPEFINTDPRDTFIMKYNYVELVHIKKALSMGDKETAKKLFYQLEKQRPLFFAEDYLTLKLLLNRMGLAEEAKKYSEIAKHTVNSEIFNEK
jgi:hypothetical protein